jgi:ATP-dependent Clp protease ATP-binding subunit ClpA
MDLVRSHFRPEYLNRLDEIIIFRSLSREDIGRIVRLQLLRLADRVRRSAGIELAFTDMLVEHVAAEGFDPAYGARPIKRLIQREIENALAQEILTRKLPEKVTVGYKEGKVVVEGAAAET